jgi:hypothetical protein
MNATDKNASHWFIFSVFVTVPVIYATIEMLPPGSARWKDKRNEKYEKAFS